MIMWLCILIGTLILSVLGLLYLISRVGKFAFIRKISKEIKWRMILISLAIVIMSLVIIDVLLGYVNLCVVLIHLTLFWLLSELIIWICSKCFVKIREAKIYLAGIMALLITFVYLGYGFYNDRHVVVTSYEIESEKVTQPLRMVQFTDSHMGTTFDGEGFAKHMELVQSLNPDVVLMTGDYIDGSSIYEDIIVATKAMGQLKTTYGKYFIFGNHDKNYYGEEGRRDFSETELIKELEKNDIVVLEDEIVRLNDEYVIIGRQDKTVASRRSISELVASVNAGEFDLDLSKSDKSGELFMIDLNHQPNDYANEEAAGVDLVLSGHTHGGQLFPIINAGIWLGQNDKTYGYEKRSNTNFIVSSGISDWALDFKTGCVSEVVVIDIVPIKE